MVVIQGYVSFQVVENCQTRPAKSARTRYTISDGHSSIDTAPHSAARRFMNRQVLIYGLIGGVLIALLKWTAYRFLVIEHSIEIYGGLITTTFAVLGIGVGLKLTGKQQQVVVKEVPVPAGQPFIPNERRREELRITFNRIFVAGAPLSCLLMRLSRECAQFPQHLSAASLKKPVPVSPEGLNLA